ncbi:MULTISPECIES: VOC family protein [Roseobacteraceae]|uniref:VOC family protein n=1 Tax=Roseobacteraceae TaxID=2854170 RepID=UPI001C48FB99|nr:MULTISPECIES: VOC family protein [Roseobacteraceae]MBV7408927.1 VOC family protein [Maritimibacter sp. DP1N21-5]MBY5934386.1 VOC family protein [Tateyamaria omphalii]
MFFDHLVVGATMLEAARTHVEEALGVKMQPGGSHAVFQTHNALMGLEDGIYLEAIAPNPEVSPPKRPRWYDLDRFEGQARLSNWACSVSDMDRALNNMPSGAGTPVAVRRGDLAWRMAVSEEGTTPFDNLWPALIEWPAGVHPATQLEPTGIRLRRLTLSHPDGDALAAALAPHLSDDRVSVEVGAVGMCAEFDTPHGPRVL